MKKSKASSDVKIAIVGDMHCGHIAGLTPPQWTHGAIDDEGHPLHKLAVISDKLWNWYAAAVAQVGAVDCVIGMGDAIDGKGEKSGGTEIIEPDRLRQADMAIECYRVWQTSHRVFVYGTGYHTGNSEDFEAKVADAFNAKIGSHEWIEANGIVIDCKHHLGSSSVPHGRSTALARDALWNQIWAVEGLQPAADIYVRAHVHYHQVVSTFSQSKGRYRTAFTNLPLQYFSTKYGARRCSGLVHYGFTVLTIHKDGRYQLTPYSPNLAWTAPTAFQL